MGDGKITEQQAADLLSVLRSGASLDAKVQHVTTIKSQIKQHNVPEACAAQIFDGLRSASTSQHAALVNAGFTALNHLLTRLSRQEPALLVKEAARTLPVIVEKLGDPKDRLRGLATQALGTLYGVAAQNVERAVRSSAMTGNNPRAKAAAMQWLLQTDKSQGLPFRGYVPLLMDLLEDADGMVRDTAKSTVIELFKTAPNTAKSDLKRQLKNFKVRPAIEQAIIKALAPTAGRPDTPADAAPLARPVLYTSVSSASTERPITPVVDMQVENIEPMYVNTQRELDDLFRDMLQHFDGKETEQNWMKREQSMGTLRKLNAGNAPVNFQDAFVAGLRSMLDGIIKAVVSLRTSLSKEACGVVQDIARSLGPAMDPLVELLMQTFVKLSAGTKKISSQLANTTVDILISRVSYTARLLQHVCGACQDKNVQPRMYGAAWLQTILKKESHHKAQVGHGGGMDLMEKCIKKGLGDPNPGVREKMRSTFWTFWAVWPGRADAIMADIDPTAQRLLTNDPCNPNATQKAAVPARPGLGLSRSTMAASKLSLRETMMAQKRVTLASRNLPARPGSAMAHISPIRTASSSSTQSASAAAAATTTTTAAAAKPSVTRSRQEASISVAPGGMSVAPMRPTRRRPDVLARPATAGPYSARDQGASIEVESPESFKSKAFTPKPKEPSPKRTAPRSRPGHAPHASEPRVLSPLRAAAAAAAAAPRAVKSPPRTRHPPTALFSPTPTQVNEDISLVVPQLSSMTSLPPPQREESITEPFSPPMPITHSPRAPDLHPSSNSSPAPAPQAFPPVLKVYEDPATTEQPHAPTTPTPTPTFPPTPVLEDKPVNEHAAALHLTANGVQQQQQQAAHPTPQENLPPPSSPDKSLQNSRLLDSGIAKIKARTIEGHGFRKLQSLLRDARTRLPQDKFDALALGLFRFLEEPAPSTGATPSDRAHDDAAQILTTLKILLHRERARFPPLVPRGLAALLHARATCDTGAHLVSGLELLADELVPLGSAPDMLALLTADDPSSSSPTSRTLSMGLHVLASLLVQRADFSPDDAQRARLAALAGRCLAAPDSAVRLDAVKLCVALHERLGNAAFWPALRDLPDDSKSLITYYVVRRQREREAAAAVSSRPLYTTTAS